VTRSVPSSTQFTQVDSVGKPAADPLRYDTQPGDPAITPLPQQGLDRGGLSVVDLPKAKSSLRPQDSERQCLLRNVELDG